MEPGQRRALHGFMAIGIKKSRKNAQKLRGGALWAHHLAFTLGEQSTMRLPRKRDRSRGNGQQKHTRETIGTRKVVAAKAETSEQHQHSGEEKA